MTKLLFRVAMTPNTGSVVVKGYGAIFGLAAEQDDIRVDLPTLGSPMRPTSARSLSSRSSVTSSPLSPFSASTGLLVHG